MTETEHDDAFGKRVEQTPEVDDASADIAEWTDAFMLRIGELEDENARLRKLLAQHGWHTPLCGVRCLNLTSCTCGWREVRAEFRR